MHQKVSISVVYPQPDDPRVILKSTNIDIPSCVPKSFIRNVADRIGQTNTVYKGVPLELEILVSNGVNLTFHWSIRKVTDGDGSNQNEDILDRTVQCLGICYSSYLVSDIIISPNEVFGDIMVLASPPRPRPTLTRKIFNLSLSNLI